MGHTVGSNTHNNSHVDAEAFYNEGERLANLGHYRKALVVFDQAIATCPEDSTTLVATWVFRAVVLIHLQSYDEALGSCDRALALAPKHVEAWVFRGVALNYLEQYSASYASYAKAMKLAQPQNTSDPRSFADMGFFQGMATTKFTGPYASRLTHRWDRYIRSPLRTLWQRLKRLRVHH